MLLLLELMHCSLPANNFIREKLVNNVKISKTLNVELFAYDNMWRQILNKYLK